MTRYFLMGAALLLASCAPMRTIERTAYYDPKRPPKYKPVAWPKADSLKTPVPPALPLPDSTRRPDSVVVQPHRSLLDKALGREPKRGIHALPTRIGKKSTVNVYYGPATVTTAGKKATVAAGPDAAVVQAAKKAGPVATGAGDATTQAGAGVASTITGDGNAPTLTSTGSPKATVGATVANNLTRPLGYVIGAVVLAVVVAGGGGWLWVLWKRSKKAADAHA